MSDPNSNFRMSLSANGVLAAVVLQVRAEDALERHLEPVTCGIPWPRGVLYDLCRLSLHDELDNQAPLQARVLDRWPDGSVRWVLLDWQAGVRGQARYQLRITSRTQAPATGPDRLRLTQSDGAVEIDTGPAQFRLRVGGAFPFVSAIVEGSPALDPEQTRFRVEDSAGRAYQPSLSELRIEEAGPLRAAVAVKGKLAAAGAEPLGDFQAMLHFFAGSSTVRFVVTLRNPRRAQHPGGLWDLGDAGSVFLRDAALTVALPVGDGAARVRCSAEPGAPFEEMALPVEVYQDSSGGENWQSTNHLNRHHVVPNSFRGYRLRCGSGERTGRRATPILALERGRQTLAVALRHFWQNFPMALEASTDALTLRLFPRQYADVHELQGGEQKTHTFHVAFGRDAITAEPLAWCREPLLPIADPEWYCATGAVPYLTPRARDPHADYLRLVDAAIEGDDTFAHKREAADEYGWRHFGDIYGDHEAVYHKGPTPLLSHYNNQYDPVAGFACQFLRGGDPRWWRQMDELAAHVIDIDTYHTDQDKAAYNHGLFWHTYHYIDADTAMHRSYPKASGVCGGGPSCEHNYTGGLLLHYFLTGRPASREAVMDFGRWVLAMDDGRRTIFRWLAGEATGLASSSGNPLYHGPGRGAGNSLNALLDAYRLTADPMFEAKAEELIRRCIHPDDDIAARNLLDVERRWFYTIFLQALGRYLDDKAERGSLDRTYAYARASLLHYARWMAEYEYPYLDRPEVLEYPTETWAAQDMRKCEVFQYAARHATGAERERFRERAEFFFRSSTTTLTGMKTRSLCRPVVLLLSYGFRQAHFQQHPDETAPPPAGGPFDFGRPEVFVPQKHRAVGRFKLLAVAGAALMAAALGWTVLAWAL